MPHLSDSQVQSYTNCPTKWAADKIDRIEGDASDALILGSAFHEVLENDGRQRIAHKALMTEKELRFEFRRVLRNTAAQMDPKGNLNHILGMMEARGEAMIAAYAAEVAPRYWPISVEESFDFPIPGSKGVLTDANGEPWTFTGRIDARTILADNRVAIVDWKSANKPWRENAEHFKTQATAYILSDVMTGRSPVADQVTFITFPTEYIHEEDRWVCEVDIRVTRRSVSQLASYVALIRRVATEISAIRAGEREPQTTPNPLCPWCMNLPNCREGIEWMKAKGKPLPFLQPGHEGTHIPISSTAKPKAKRTRKNKGGEELSA